jgi:hypothetical protein
MGVLARRLTLAICLAAISPAVVHSEASPFGNLSLRNFFPHFFRLTIYNFQTPENENSMDLADQQRARGHRRDKNALKYLREMISICRRHHRRDLMWQYESAWEFASTIVYGPLPPREQDLSGCSFQPYNPPMPAPAPGPRPAIKEQPLRTIVSRFTRPYRTWMLEYETLECGHTLLAPVGYSIPAKRRRCAECARLAKAQTKKPTASAKENRGKKNTVTA